MDVSFFEVEWSDAVKLIPGKLELQAPVREFSHCAIESGNEGCAILAEGEKRGWLKFDGEDITDIQRLKCIVVGRAYEWGADEWGADKRGADEQVHYVLVVTQRLEGRHHAYERVGVASIQRRHISFRGGKFKARII